MPESRTMRANLMLPLTLTLTTGVHAASRA